MKDKKTLKPIDIFFGILAFICIFIFVLHYSSIFVKASSSNNPLPLTNYTAPSYLSDEDIANFNTIITTKPSIFGNHIIDLTSDGIICVNVQLDHKPVGVRQYEDVMGYVFYKPYSYTVTVSNYDSFNLFSTDTVTLTLNGYESWQFWHCVPSYSNGVNGWYGGYQSQGNSVNISLFGLGNEVTITNTFRNPDTFIQGYPIYWSSPFYNGGSTVPIVNQPILAYGKPGYVVQEGHATNPDFDNNNNTTSDGSSTQPNTPQFPIFVLPTIDTSTIETLLESLINTVKALADYLGECFSVFFSWLVGVIQNGLQSIINTIREQTQFLYDNFVSLFESISNNISYLVQPIDSSIIFDNISSTSFVSNISLIENSLSSFASSFDNLSEPNSYLIPIHLELLPSSLFGTLTTQYIDLSVINPIKTALRTFLWALTTYSLFITIVDSIANYINGGQDE